MVLWQSPDTPVMFCFHVSGSSRALSRLRALVFGSRHSCLEFWLRDGVRTLASRVRSAARSSVHVCFVLLHAVCVFIGCVHSCYVLCCVACSLCFSLAVCFHVVMSCVNTWLMSFLISCVFVSYFAHGWWFVCWSCACVLILCEHVASVLVFCVPCSLMSIVLTPPILLPDYWLITPTWFSSSPSSFAPFIISLCLQSCASSSSNFPVAALSCPALPSLATCPVFVLFY